MQSFTSMSEPAIEAVIDANKTRQSLQGLPYMLALNPADFERLVSALKVAYEADQTETGDWCASYLSGIAETLGVEFV